MLKINTTSKYAEFKSETKSDLYPLNEISYTVENESETVSFYNRFYNKIVTEQISNIQVNDVPVSRDNIQDLLSVLFASNEGGGGGGTVDLSNYYTKPETNTLLDNKVDKVDGKQLSTEDYTTEEKAKLAGLENYDDTAVKADITANTEAIEAEVTRAKAAEKVNSDAIAAIDAAYKSADTTLQGNIDAEVTRATTAESELNTKIDTKVDKVDGKQLSTEDYTTAEKAKLASLENYDDTTVKGDIVANTEAIEAEVERATAAETALDAKIPTVQTGNVGTNKNYIYSDFNDSTYSVLSSIGFVGGETDVDVYHAKWGGGTKKEKLFAVTTTKAGVMSTADKIKLDSLENYDDTDLRTLIETKADKDKYEKLSPSGGGIGTTSFFMKIQIKYQYIDVSECDKEIRIYMPSINNNDIDELHLLMNGIMGKSFVFVTDMDWKETPTEIVEGATYEFIFTWVKSQNKWYAGYIKYE